MAIRGVNLSEKEEFIHPDDPGHPKHPDFLEAEHKGKEPEKPTRYFIGNLTANDRIEFGDMSATPTMRDGGITMSMRNVQKAYAVVQRGLKGWENQLDSKGQPVAFKLGTAKSTDGSMVEVVHNECMVHLPQSIILDLSMEIQRKNGMGNELTKKLDGLSPQSDVNNLPIGDAAIVQMQPKQSEDAPNLQSAE